MASSERLATPTQPGDERENELNFRMISHNALAHVVTERCHSTRNSFGKAHGDYLIRGEPMSVVGVNEADFIQFNVKSLAHYTVCSHLHDLQQYHKKL